jgi:hypothetical protein
VSWLDLLSSADLAYKPENKEKLRKEILFLFDKTSIPSFFNRNFFSYPTKEREVFRDKVRDRIAKKKHSLIFLEENFPPLINFANFKSKSLTYKIDISSRGKVLLVTPLTLPINSSTSLWLERYLKESVIFLEKDNFFWTKMEVVIK